MKGKLKLPLHFAQAKRPPLSCSLQPFFYVNALGKLVVPKFAALEVEEGMINVKVNVLYACFEVVKHNPHLFLWHP